MGMGTILKCNIHIETEKQKTESKKEEDRKITTQKMIIKQPDDLK